MPTISYLNFDLLLNELGDGYQARVIDSPAGQASHSFYLPFSASELESLVLWLGKGRSSDRSLDVETHAIPSAKKLGGALFESVFSGEIAERFRTSLAIAERENKGLRICLRLSGALNLVGVPWELLFDTANGGYIGLSVNTPIIRKLDLARPPVLRQTRGVLRVLVMISSPAGYHVLDVEGEWKRINVATQKLQAEGKIVLERVGSSLAALQRVLRCGEYHVFHYIGHGGFDQHNNDGLLVLEDQNGKCCLVSGQSLGAILRDESTLQLVLLNSCSGGRTSITDPFAGVGQSLLQKGIPAVIAMQFEITDKAAVTFAHEFYAALTDGYPIDAAVAEARKMIYVEASQFEWATPVLYTSVDNGSFLRDFSIGGAVSKAGGRFGKPGLWIGGVTVLCVMAAVIFGGVYVPGFAQPSVSRTDADVFPAVDLKESSHDGGKDTSSAPMLDFLFEPQMVSISAGTFIMGCQSGRDDGNGGCTQYEKPEHKVAISAFQIGKYEVTFKEWDACYKEGACPEISDSGWGRSNRPVINLSWFNVQTYIGWLRGKTGKQYRLPTEAEWEYAARAGKNTAYPWGNKIDCDQARYGNYAGECTGEGTVDVGSYSPNAYGLYDTSGNVAEFTADCWYMRYDDASADGRARSDCATGMDRVIRGGSWGNRSKDIRSAWRFHFSPGDHNGGIGFRLALDG